VPLTAANLEQITGRLIAAFSRSTQETTANMLLEHMPEAAGILRYRGADGAATLMADIERSIALAPRDLQLIARRQLKLPEKEEDDWEAGAKALKRMTGTARTAVRRHAVLLAIAPILSVDAPGLLDTTGTGFALIDRVEVSVEREDGATLLWTIDAEFVALVDGARWLGLPLYIHPDEPPEFSDSFAVVRPPSAHDRSQQSAETDSRITFPDTYMKRVWNPLSEEESGWYTYIFDSGGEWSRDTHVVVSTAFLARTPSRVADEVASIGICMTDRLNALTFQAIAPPLTVRTGVADADDDVDFEIQISGYPRPVRAAIAYAEGDNLVELRTQGGEQTVEHLAPDTGVYCNVFDI
jgi:hypothetical protein